MPPNLGIIAGGGPLPREVADNARAAGRQVFVVCLAGIADPADYADLPHRAIPYGKVASIFDTLRGAGAEEVLLVGPVRRPSIAEMGLDRRGLSIIWNAGKRVLQGDDSLLRVIVEAIEAEGFRVVGPDAFLGGGEVPPGPVGQHTPSEPAMADIRRGIAVLNALAPLDVGQAVVVQEGIVLAVEASEGTDAMLNRVQTLRREPQAEGGSGGVLVKLAKTGQEQRTDLPTVGLATVRKAISLGLEGIAIGADSTLLVQKEKAVAAADEAGVFLYGLEADADPAEP